MTDVFEGAFGDSPEVREPAPAAPAAPDPKPQPEPAQQEQPQGEAAPAADPEPQTAVPVSPPEGFVPKGALDEARDRARRAEQEAERLRQPQGSRIPDAVEDPDGFEAYQQQRDAAVRWSAITSTSQLLATNAHGAEKVKEAVEAFAAEAGQKPWLIEELRRQPHPYDWVVNRHERETAFANVTPEQLAAFQAWQAAGGAQQPNPAPAPAAAAPATPPKTPTPSINRSPSAGGTKPGETPVHPGAAFEAAFPK